MEQLAEASGGKLFPAASIRDLEPVFPDLTQELRSVYSVAYYPENQQFDGNWRKVAVEVNRQGVVIRARLGYFAR
jgi:VWFA-related protein